MKLLIHSKAWEWIGIFVSLFIASMLTYMMGRKLYKPCYPLRPRQNECYFADDKVNCIFLNENVWISIKISLKFVPKGPINNIQVLVQIVAWRRPGAKPLSEPMVASLLTHIYVTRPQWVNKQRVLMHRHQGLNVRHGLCHIYMRYLYIYMSCL